MKKYKFVTNEIDQQISDLANSIASIKREDVPENVNPILYILTRLSERIFEEKKRKRKYFRNVDPQEIHDSVVLLVAALNIKAGSGTNFSMYTALQEELKNANEKQNFDF